jgi:glycosyltransferase involved in cell wall biosynthesis
MKVAIDISASLYGTGVSDYVVNLVSHLPSDQLKLFGSSLRGNSTLRQLFPTAHLLPFPPAALHLLWNKLHILPPEAFIGRFDVLHSSDWTQPPTAAKSVTTIHDLTPFLFPEHLDSQIISAHKARLGWVVKECSAVICVSQNTKKDFLRLFSYPENRVHVIPEALPNRFMLSPQASPYSNYLVAIGARQPRKNISRLTETFLAYKSQYSLPDKLVIIGESPV